MDSKDQHDNNASRRQLTTARDQREDGNHSDCHTTSQHACQSASQHGHNPSRKRKLDVRTQHSDTSSQHNHDAQLRDAVSDGRWWDVPDLITSGVSDACRAWAVEEACRNADPAFVEFHILPRCTRNQLCSLLHVLVPRGLWPALRFSFDLGVIDEQRRLAVQTVSEEGNEDSVLAILPYCPGDLLDSVVLRVCGRGLWRAVSRGLQWGVSDTVRRSVVEAACGRADEYNLTQFILRHYDDDQKDGLLDTLLMRWLWGAVSLVLQRGVSDTVRRRAVEFACGLADEDHLIHGILGHCHDDQVDTVIRRLIARHLWGAVSFILQCGVGDTVRRLVVETASETAADEDSVLMLLPYCPDDLLDTVLVQVTRRRLWRAVIAVLQRGVSDTERKWAVQAACDRADEQHLTHGILFHCHDDQMDSVLTRLVKRSLWGAARWLLVQPRDDESVPGVSIGTLTELTQATDAKLSLGIATGTDAPCIQTSDAKLSSAGSVGISNQNTQAVNDIFIPDTFTATHTHCPAPAEDTDCNEEMNDACTVLTQAVERRVWCTVSAVLHYINNNRYSRCRDIQLWAVEEACNHADDRQLSEIVTACGEDQLYAVLKETTTRGLWKTVCTVLERASHRALTDTADTQRWGVGRVGKCTNSDGVGRNSGKFTIQLEGKRNINTADTFHVCLVEDFADTCQVCIIEDIAGRMMEGCSVNVIGFSTAAKCAAVLQEAVRRGLCEWTDVDTDNNHDDNTDDDNDDNTDDGDDDNTDDRDDDNTDDDDDNTDYDDDITDDDDDDNTDDDDDNTDDDDDDNTDDGDDDNTDNGDDNTDDDADDDNTHDDDDRGNNESLRYDGAYPVIKCTEYSRALCARGRPKDLLLIGKGVTVRPGMREPFCQLLTITDYTSSSDTERWAVQEACKRADDEDCVAIVDVCAVDQLNAMLTEAVRRGLWKTVIWLLARIRITDTRDTHSITVEEACTRIEDGGFVAVMCFSTEARREAAMTEAVRRGLCERTNNDSATCKRTSDGKGVAVCFSTQAQRDAVMTEAVRRGLCKRIDDDSGASDTERWTSPTNVWEKFCMLLQTVNYHIHNTSDTERWAVEEACKRAADGECKYIVDFCDENQLYTVLTGVVRRGLWKTVVRLLVELQDTQFLLDPVICSGVSDCRRWAVEEACKCYGDTVCKDMVQFCDKDQLDTVLTEAVRRGLWTTVIRLLDRIRKEHVSNVNYTRRWAVEEACKRAGDDAFTHIVVFCLDDQRETVLTQAMTRCLWETVTMLLKNHYTISGTALTRALVVVWDCATDVQFCKAAFAVGQTHPALVARLLRKKGMFAVASDIVSTYVDDKDRAIGEVLAQWAELFVDSLSVQFDEDLDLSVAELELNTDLHGIIKVVEKDLHIVIDAIRRNHKGSLSVTPESTLWQKKHSFHRAKSGNNTDVYLHFFEWCVQRRGGTTSLCQLSLPLIATQTVNPALQSLARTSMWEETRRWYLQFLVEEKLWAVVKEVADHSVYDDQREWALEQARHHKQWDVVVLLADHGLTDNHRWRVYRQVAKYADWDAVRLLFKRGVDIRQVCQELIAANPSHERPPDNRADIERRRNRGEDVSKMEAEYRERSERVARLALEHKKRCRELYTLEKRQASRRRGVKMSWYAVTSQLRQDVTEEGIETTLQHAIQSEAWSVVMQLVRLGMDAAQRDLLFPETIRRRQWGVARALLEQGVSVELSRAALPELMETGQWILVASVMEQSLDDTDRRRVMQAALDKKEGSVVAHGISVMEGRLSVEERQAMYDQALGQGVWQAVRRLVEEKDSTGIAQRDEALVAAVDNHRWDIVEHCVLHGANINKQNAKGDTMLHEKAKQGDWDSVDGLVDCGADPNMTDRRGYSAFHITVNGAVRPTRYAHRIGPWVAVKTSMKFHGNLNRPDPEGHTPLKTLINCRYPYEAAEILDEALWWGSDVAQGQRVNSRGRTVLHVMCEVGRWKSIQYVLARGVNPLAVDDFGDTALAVAVRYWESQDKVGRTRYGPLAECIKLGISTHQPPITDTNTEIWFSPVYISMQNAGLVVLHMLYESGACSHRELFAVFDDLPRPSYCDDWRYRNNKDLYEKAKSRYKQSRSYLKKVATTPRSLQSTCRLVISHHLGICKHRTRQKRVKRLCLPDRMKDYVLLSDLVDPEKVKDTVTQLTSEDDRESDNSEDDIQWSETEAD